MLRQRVQMVFQSPYASLNPRWKIGDILLEPINAFNLIEDKANRQKRVIELLQQVGMSAHDQTKYPHEFSGGQRQRISIARALACYPELIICDEPTSALDVSVQAQVLNLLKDLQNENTLTYLFISHDLAVISNMADKIGVLKDGELVEEGETSDYWQIHNTPIQKCCLLQRRILVPISVSTGDRSAAIGPRSYRGLAGLDIYIVQ